MVVGVIVLFVGFMLIKKFLFLEVFLIELWWVV